VNYVFRDDPQLVNLRLNVGLTGFGKTSLLRHQLGRIVALNRRRARDRIILVDPSADDFHFETFGRRVTTAGELYKVMVSLQTYHVRLITSSIEVFDYACWESYRQGDVFLIVDELWNFCASKAGALMQPPAFNRLVTQSRHAGIRLLATCQRPTQVHNNFLNLCQEVNVFRTEDLERLKTKLRSKENQEQALHLKRFEFFCCANGDAMLCTVPKRN
jgi:DNA helicase HerA-like ATPase